MNTLYINPAFEALIPPLGQTARRQLHENIVSAGRAVKPIEVWYPSDRPGPEILDGHNRYDICLLEHLPFSITEVTLDGKVLTDDDEAKQWMILNQRGTRSLSDDQQILLAVRQGAPVALYSAARVAIAREVLAAAPDLADKVLSCNDFGLIAAKGTLQLRRNKATGQKPAQATRTKPPKGRAHIVIGDTQVKPGVQTDHLTWIGRYIAEQFTNQDVAIVHLGDHWDMPSLSSYDFGKKEIEGKRYVDDIEAGNVAMGLLNAPIEAAMARGKWKPERHFLFGNHEERILRACNDHPALAGALSLDALALTGWTTHKFLEPAILDGIHYSHYFYNPNTGRPYCGENLYPRLKTIGHSFTMGHQQGLQYCLRPVGGARHQGLVLGSTYLHDEKYLGPQGNANWRGIVVCHQVENGQYDPMFVSLDFLCRKYEGRTLAQFMAVAA